MGISTTKCQEEIIWVQVVDRDAVLFGWSMPIDFNVLKINGVLPTTVEVFTGCKVGDIIELMGKEWKIEDVIF